VPDKRRDSKHRRAARNKAQRGSLAARRENAAAVATTAPASASAGKGSAGGRGAAAAAPAGVPVTAAPPPEGGVLGLLRSNRPGDKAVALSLVLAIVGALAMLFLPFVQVDDRGEQLPRQFGAVALMARETVTGNEVPKETTSLLSAQGPQILLIVLVPVAVAGFAVWANRRPDRSRLLTYAMIVMAGIALFLGVYFLGALIALFVGGYQIRRAEGPPRPARARAGAARRGRGEVIDVESTEAAAEAEAEPEPAGDADPDGNGAADGWTDGKGNGSGTRKRRR
jgi:hypothetical protein